MIFVFIFMRNTRFYQTRTKTDFRLALEKQDYQSDFKLFEPDCQERDVFSKPMSQWTDVEKLWFVHYSPKTSAQTFTDNAVYALRMKNDALKQLEIKRLILDDGKL